MRGLLSFPANFSSLGSTYYETGSRKLSSELPFGAETSDSAP
jgi:hypothetical protein